MDTRFAQLTLCQAETRVSDGLLMAEALDWLFKSEDPAVREMMQLRTVAGLVQPAVNRTLNKED